MPKTYKVKLVWEVTVKNCDTKEEAIDHASEQLYDDMSDPDLSRSGLDWVVEEA